MAIQVERTISFRGHLLRRSIFQLKPKTLFLGREQKVKYKRDGSKMITTIYPVNPETVRVTSGRRRTFREYVLRKTNPLGVMYGAESINDNKFYCKNKRGLGVETTVNVTYVP